MNATFTSANMEAADNGNGSDSDTNLEDTPEYYQPISAVDDEDEDSDQINSDGDLVVASDSQRFSNGIASLQLNDDVEQNSNAEEEEKEEEDKENSDSVILRAFREDESRRNAPLTPENSVRVMEAMRGISFGGVAPDWAGSVPEDQWIDRLRRLRQPPHQTSTALHNL